MVEEYQLIENKKMISEEKAAFYKSEKGIKLYGGLFDIREGESDEVFRSRPTLLWLAE